MSMLWKYVRPKLWWVVLALALAGLAQVLELVDPLILGKIIDDYAINPSNMPQEEAVR